MGLQCNISVSNILNPIRGSEVWGLVQLSPWMFYSRDAKGIWDIYSDLADMGDPILQVLWVLLQHKWELRQDIWGILDSARHICTVFWAGSKEFVALLYRGFKISDTYLYWMNLKMYG